MYTKLSKPIEKKLILRYNKNRWCFKMLNNELKMEPKIDEVYSKQTKEVKELLDLAKRNLEQREYIKNHKTKIKKVRSISAPIQVNLQDLSEIETILNQKLNEIKEQMTLYSKNLEYIFHAVQEKEEQGNQVIEQVAEKYISELKQMAYLKAEFTKQEEALQQVKQEIGQYAKLQINNQEITTVEEEKKQNRQQVSEKLRRLEEMQEQQKALAEKMITILLQKQDKQDESIGQEVIYKLQAITNISQKIDENMVQLQQLGQVKNSSNRIEENLEQLKQMQKEVLPKILKQQGEAFQTLNAKQEEMQKQLVQLDNQSTIKAEFSEIENRYQVDFCQLQEQLRKIVENSITEKLSSLTNLQQEMIKKQAKIEEQIQEITFDKQPVEEQITLLEEQSKQQMEKLQIELQQGVKKIQEEIAKENPYPIATDKFYEMQQAVKQEIIDKQEQLYKEGTGKIIAMQEDAKQTILEIQLESQNTIKEIELRQEELLNGQTFYFDKIVYEQGKANASANLLQENLLSAYQEQNEKEKMVYRRQIQEQEEEIRRLHIEMEKYQDKLEKMLQRKERQGILSWLMGKEVEEEQTQYVSQILAYNL